MDEVVATAGPLWERMLKPVMLAVLNTAPEEGSMDLAGAVAALYRRAFWGLLLLALPGAFYVWSMHSSGGTPIFLPMLKPFSYYNSRYGMAVIPLLAFAAAAIVAVLPLRARPWVAAVLVLGLASAAQAGGRDDADSSGGYAVGPVGQSFKGASSAPRADLFAQSENAYGYAAVSHPSRARKHRRNR